MKTNLLNHCWGGLAVLLSCCSQAYGATVIFDNYASPTDNDYVNNFDNPGGHTQITTDGITGGSLLPSGFAENATFMDSFDPQAGLTTSMFMRYDETAFPQWESGPSIQLGFTGRAGGGLDPLFGTTYFFGHFFNDGSLGIFSPGSSANGFNTVATFATPTSRHWLRLTFSEAYLGSDQFDLSVRLEDFGLDGMSTPSVLGEGSLRVSNAPAVADDSVYASFNGFYRVSHFDNFTVVPEPNPLWLFTAGLSILFVYSGYRKRRSPASSD